MATLEEVPLKFGQVVQLQLVRLDQSRLYAKLVGYLINQVVLVTMPGLSEPGFEILEGDEFVCRAFAGRLAIGFGTRVIRVSHLPFPHLYLTYPKQVESVVVRKAPRLAIEREAALLKTTDQGESREPAKIIDISVTGSCALAKPDFAAVKDAVTLLLPAGKPEEAEIRLAAVVRSTRPGDSGAGPGTCQYGLEFTSLSSEETRAVEKLILEQLTRGL